MKLLIVENSIIPVLTYGGTQRDIWAQGKEMVKMGHEVSYLVKKGSKCSFGEIIPYNEKEPVDTQIPDYVDVVHFHAPLKEKITKKPYMITIHGNGKPNEVFDINTVFVSKNHAERHNSDQYVYNGLDLEELGDVDLNTKRNHLLFLAKASRREKNLKGAVKIAKKANYPLAVVGGKKLSFNKKIVYHGMMGGGKKNKIIQHSDALLFPIRWHEPLGLAILESLYFGCPVIGTKYGSLPELISEDMGFLSNSYSEMINAVNHINQFNRKKCHEFVCDNFSARKMTEDYLILYEKILNGEKLNRQQPKSLIQEKQKLLPIAD
ncbi:MAG: glycosyltransferase family 4 protein [Chlorobi bacterium]|nr:glycosyltransferase family 4 protein [Chlorobiota bacterium]